MSVRVGKARSALREVKAGAPQGSVLGGFLFNVGVDNLEDGCDYKETSPTRREHQPMVSDCPATSTPTRVMPLDMLPTMSPIREEEPTLQFLPRTINIPPQLRQPKDPRWIERPPLKLKFIDDGAHLAKVNLQRERLLLEGGKFIKEIHDQRTQNMFDHVVKRAEERGMRVNDRKTVVVCISAATSFQARAIVYGRQEEVITSQQSLKILGFTLDSDGGFATHVANIVKKMRSRIWALNRLKQHGFESNQLVQVYQAFIRPITEYVSVVWHSRITAEQSAEIERMQSRALRHIYGFGLSARKMRELSGLQLLSRRRTTAVEKFARKKAESERFGHWFARRPQAQYPRRSRQYDIYQEPTARTDRYRNSALNYMRRLLNRE